ncbi:hybrid sensor histidine kinase/response regulator [Tunicatimonas pelagia]|uniref:hybrid sensor histidine kinase/response regulator n=1 Tax=Tunicatimonas pelagia TaxID=931531 RepID=UPI0026662134|nr:ATP-binding protein [Tunicatimonas pelagia]WKN44757.1 ATP-binding protein [Tunicatimonas pelagia]
MNDNDSIVQEKLAYFHQRSQYVVFNRQGQVQDSCHTLFEIPLSGSLYDRVPFLEAMQETFHQLPVGEDISFLCIRTNLIGREGYFNLHIKRRTDDRWMWFIYDLTEFYSYLQPWQQERNDQAIAGEYLRIQQKAAALEKELLQYRNEELHRIEQMKTAFFSQVSHEMRTPLNSIVGLAHLLSQQATPAMQAPSQALEATAHHLANIINDVLDWSKLENNTIEIDTAPFLVEPTVRNVVEAFRPTCQEKGVNLTLTIASEVPECLIGDATRLSQILYNLLGNATKFTHQGAITVSINLAEGKPKGELVHLRFSVADTGIGMTRQEQQRIANPYVQANAKIHQEYGGTGLGLSIVKKIIERVDGTWNISSRPQQGTTVTIELPLSVGKMPDVKPEPSSPSFHHIHKVLVAEDDLINQKVVRRLLLQWGLHPTVVDDGKQALEHLRRGGYDLLILDYQMPKMDGAEVLTAMQNEQLATPTIVLSGNASSHMLPFCADDLFHLLTKPVLPHLLQEKITFLDGQVGRPLVNLNYLRQISDNQLALMIDLVNTFAQQAPLAVNKIKRAWHNNNRSQLHRAIHKAKPGFQYVGAATIERLLDQLEAESELPNREEYERMVQQLEEKTAQAILQLQQEVHQWQEEQKNS